MHRSLIAVALLLLAPLATAQVYKWTDASGTVHYSQAPPPQGTNYKQIKTSGSVVAPDETASAAPAHDASTPAPAASGLPMTDTPENRAKLCATLKTNLAALQGAAPVIMNQGGKNATLDAGQRKQQTDATQNQMQQYCQAG